MYATYTVTVSGVESPARAEEIVTRYFYGKQRVTATRAIEQRYTHHEVFEVDVERDFGDVDKDEAKRLMTYQRNRFGSGLYGTSQPVYSERQVWP